MGNLNISKLLPGYKLRSFKILNQYSCEQIAKRYKRTKLTLFPFPRHKQDCRFHQQPYIMCKASTADTMKVYSFFENQNAKAFIHVNSIIRWTPKDVRIA